MNDPHHSPVKRLLLFSSFQDREVGAAKPQSLKVALRIQTYNAKEWAWGPSMADTSQPGESETLALSGPCLVGCETKAAGGCDSSLVGSWSEGMVSERSKGERETQPSLCPVCSWEWSRYMPLRLGLAWLTPLILVMESADEHGVKPTPSAGVARREPMTWLWFPVYRHSVCDRASSSLPLGLSFLSCQMGMVISSSQAGVGNAERGIGRGE